MKVIDGIYSHGMIETFFDDFYKDFSDCCKLNIHQSIIELKHLKKYSPSILYDMLHQTHKDMVSFSDGLAFMVIKNWFKTGKIKICRVYSDDMAHKDTRGNIENKNIISRCSNITWLDGEQNSDGIWTTGEVVGFAEFGLNSISKLVFNLFLGEYILRLPYKNNLHNFKNQFWIFKYKEIKKTSSLELGGRLHIEDTGCI